MMQVCPDEADHAAALRLKIGRRQVDVGPHDRKARSGDQRRQPGGRPLSEAERHQGKRHARQQEINMEMGQQLERPVPGRQPGQGRHQRKTDDEHGQGRSQDV